MQAGKQFDPDLSALFIQLIDREGEKLLAATGPLQLVA
jgi:putative two-component system response regulator